MQGPELELWLLINFRLWCFAKPERDHAIHDAASSKYQDLDGNNDHLDVVSAASREMPCDKDQEQLRIISPSPRPNVSPQALAQVSISFSILFSDESTICFPKEGGPQI